MNASSRRYAQRKESVEPRTDGFKVCRSCGEDKPRTEFYGHPLGPDGRAPSCKSCERDRLRKRRHGMTGAEREQIAQDQGGCAICRRPEPGAKGWVVDHDHECCSGDISCGKCRRGVLCQWCNSMLGYALDDPQTLAAAIGYLVRHGVRSGVRSGVGATDPHTESRTDVTNGRTHERGGHLA